MKLVTFDDGRVGRLDDDTVIELDVPDMRRYFELGGEVEPTGREVALEDVRLRAPIIPKKFFHTAGNHREHKEETTPAHQSHRGTPSQARRGPMMPAVRAPRVKELFGKISPA